VEVRARWEHFEHESDIGVRGHGPTLAAALEQVGLALMAVVVELAAVREREEVAIACESVDRELLLVEWLDALVYQMSVTKRVFARFEVQVEEPAAESRCAALGLRARCYGERIDVARHQPAVEVKGATLCALSVAQSAEGWVAQCVVDV
jgi:SHS2 domain-containing protein